MTLSKEKERLLQRLRNARLRRKEGLFLIEGVRGGREFMKAGLPIPIRFALVSPRLGENPGGEELFRMLEEASVPLYSVEDEALSRLSDTESPQGVLMVAVEPEDPSGARERIRERPNPRLLVLDGIQDPGNVGTLVRSARAFGLDGVVALDGTADPWGAKVVRSGAGSLAHIPVFRMAASDLLAWVREMSVDLLAAESGGVDVGGVRLHGGWALVVGNEGAGIRMELREAAHAVLSVPMAPGVDSLNAAVAGSLLLYALSSGRGHPGASGDGGAEASLGGAGEPAVPESTDHSATGAIGEERKG